MLSQPSRIRVDDKAHDRLPDAYPVEATHIDLQGLFRGHRYMARMRNVSGFHTIHASTLLPLSIYILRLSHCVESSLVSPAEPESERSSVPGQVTYSTALKPSVRPLQPAFCDSRLAEVQISKRTDVAISDSLATATVHYVRRLPNLGNIDWRTNKSLLNKHFVKEPK